MRGVKKRKRKKPHTFCSKSLTMLQPLRVHSTWRLKLIVNRYLHIHELFDVDVCLSAWNSIASQSHSHCLDVRKELVMEIGRPTNQASNYNEDNKQQQNQYLMDQIQRSTLDRWNLKKLYKITSISSSSNFFKKIEHDSMSRDSLNPNSIHEGLVFLIWLKKGLNEGVVDDVLRRNKIFQLFGIKLGMLELWLLWHSSNKSVSQNKKTSRCCSWIWCYIKENCTCRDVKVNHNIIILFTTIPPMLHMYMWTMFNCFRKKFGKFLLTPCWIVDRQVPMCLCLENN